MHNIGSLQECLEEVESLTSESKEHLQRSVERNGKEAMNTIEELTTLTRADIHVQRG